MVKLTESEWKSELKKVEQRVIALERALEALLRREMEADRSAQASDGWYSND